MDSLIAHTAPAGLVPGADEDTDVDDDACMTGEDAGVKNSAKKKAAWTEDEKKMKTETKKGKAGKKSKEWPVHLFCRMEGCEYVYCGRLRAMEYDPRKLPMKFTFRLLDAPLLRTSDDFLGLVDLADADASLGAYKAASK